MVDINLFDDNDEQQEQGDQSFDKTDGSEELNLGEDAGGILEADDGGGFGDNLKNPLSDNLSNESLDDALGFDEDLSEGQNLNGDILGDDDGLMDIDEDQASVDDEDYNFGSSKIRKPSPMFLIFIIFAVVFVYMVIFQMDFLRTGMKFVMNLVSGKKVELTQKSQTGRNLRNVAIKTNKETGIQKQKIPVDSGAVGVPSKPLASSMAVSLINSSTKVLNDLSAQGQFVTAIIQKDRFTAEYASVERGSADVFGKRLQTLMGTSSYIASPEDVHTINEKTVYLGVITGKFDNVKPSAITGLPFKSEDEFIKIIKSGIQEQNLSGQEIKKRSSQPKNDQQQISYEIMAEGDKVNAVAFLQKLKVLPGGWEPNKIRISTSNIDDYYAKKIKVVMDITVIVGPSAAKPVS